MELLDRLARATPYGGIDSGQKISMVGFVSLCGIAFIIFSPLLQIFLGGASNALWVTSGAGRMSPPCTLSSYVRDSALFGQKHVLQS